ncbi:DedA family protein [Erwinia amylovora]|uniref:DedA family protein n=1 Tax=Erwinia amylovora TaxID=552 RepID=UPI000C06F1BC|nr:DedA family protein [Erwinia amylovora]
MDVLYEIVKALWHQDFAALANPDVIWVVYGVMFLTLLLENGLLPAAFLPGDSLLLLAGAMVAKGVMEFIPTMVILTAAASLGCWLGYLQGRFLAFVRTILPTLAGVSGLKNGRFQLFNWLSGVLWVAILMGLGYAISQVPFIKRHEDQLMACLMVLPLVMLSIGLIGSIAVVIRRKKAR